MFLAKDLPELDQWELEDCSQVFDLDDEYFSFTTEQELD